MDHAVLGRYLRPFFICLCVFVASFASAQSSFQGPFQELGHSWPSMEILEVRPSVPPTSPIEEIDWTFPNQKVENPAAKWHPYAPTMGAYIQIWATEYFPRSGSFKLSDMLSENYDHYEGGKTQVRPTAVLMKRTLYGSAITGSMFVNFYQTHIFVESKLVPLSSPRNVTSTAIPYSTTGGQDTTVVAQGIPQFYVAVYSDPVVANRTGKFRMELAPSNPVVGATYWCDFVIKGGGLPGFNPDDPGLGPGNPEGTGAHSPDEGIQRNFWTSLFVPEQSSLDDLRDAANNFRSWGPFGIAAELGQKMEGQQSALPGGPCPYCFTIADSALTGPLTIDMTPVSGWLRVARMLILMLCIWQFGMSLVRWISKSKSGGDDDS